MKTLEINFFTLIIFLPLLIILGANGTISWWIVLLFFLSKVGIKLNFKSK